MFFKDTLESEELKLRNNNSYVDKGMDIGDLMLFFLLLNIINIPTGIFQIIGKRLPSTVSFKWVFSYISVLVEAITYIILVIMLYKKHHISPTKKWNFGFKFYIFIILAWLGFVLTYDNTIGLAMTNIFSDSWYYEEINTMLSDPISAFISLCLIAPIFEELIFRGYILERLTRKYSELTALIISSLFFGTIHLNFIQVPNAFFAGLILGIIYLKTKSIIPSILIHFINNSLCTLCSYMNFYNDTKFNIINLSFGIIILVFCIYVFFKNKKTNTSLISL